MARKESTGKANPEETDKKQSKLIEETMKSKSSTKKHLIENETKSSSNKDSKRKSLTTSTGCCCQKNNNSLNKKSKMNVCNKCKSGNVTVVDIPACKSKLERHFERFYKEKLDFSLKNNFFKENRNPRFAVSNKTKSYPNGQCVSNIVVPEMDSFVTISEVVEKKFTFNTNKYRSYFNMFNQSLLTCFNGEEQQLMSAGTEYESFVDHSYFIRPSRGNIVRRHGNRNPSAETNGSTSRTDEPLRDYSYSIRDFRGYIVRRHGHGNASSETSGSADRIDESLGSHSCITSECENVVRRREKGNSSSQITDSADHRDKALKESQHSVKRRHEKAKGDRTLEVADETTTNTISQSGLVKRNPSREAVDSIEGYGSEDISSESYNSIELSQESFMSIDEMVIEQFTEERNGYMEYVSTIVEQKPRADLDVKLFTTVAFFVIFLIVYLLLLKYEFIKV